MVNMNSLERDGLRQAELSPRHTMMKNTSKSTSFSLTFVEVVLLVSQLVST